MRCPSTACVRRNLRSPTTQPTYNWARKLCIFTAVTACSSTVQANTSVSPTCFDTDSFLIRVDNCASRTISNNLTDFVNPPVEIKSLYVRGIGGHVSGIMRGTLRWNIEDDEGKVHPIIILGSYYVPDAPCRLLSPQHWAQVAKDTKPAPRGTWCATYDDSIVLYWNQ